VVVVDDGSRDGSGDRAEAAGFPVLRRAESGGPAAARNLGARAVSSDVLFFLDADVLPSPDAVERVREIFASPDAPAAVFGSYDDSPDAPGLVSRYRNLLHHWTHQRGRREASTFWGACGAIRREEFLRRGGFDESYRRPSIEDIELGYRLRAAGRRIILDRDLRVTHLKRWRLGEMLRTDLVARAIPWTRLILRDRRLPDDLNTHRGGRLSVALACLAAAALPPALLSPPLAAAAGGGLVALVLLNLPFYRFLARRGGLPLALAGIPLHWLYFLTAGTGFALGLLLHLRDRAREATGPGLPEARP
jgi:hypothetical protein